MNWTIERDARGVVAVALAATEHQALGGTVTCQLLIGDCPDWVSMDADGDESPWMNNGDARCPTGQPEVA
jgi:hypothetical protein